MNRFFFCVLAISVALVGGCASEFEVRRSNPSTKPPELSRTDSVYVVLPADGTSGTNSSFGPGHYAATAVAEFFAKSCGKAVTGDKVELPDEGLATARSRQFTYCANPKILHWEDRATEWSGKRDKASLGLTITRVSTGQVIDDATIEGIGTWWTLGGLHPQDLLDRMMDQYGKGVPPPAPAP